MKIVLVNIPLNSEIGKVAKSLGFICLHHIDGDIIYNPHNNSLQKILSELDIDTLIWWGPEYNPLPKDFEKLDCYKVSVVGDWNLSFSYLKQVVVLFDLVVCDKYGLEIFHKHGFQNFSNWRGNGYNPDTFKNLNLERIYDVTFAGTINNDIHRKREKFIYRLAKLSSKIKVNIVTAIYGNDYINLLNQSKLVFNFGIRKEANMRLFESLACGALPLVEKDNMEIMDVFDKDEIAYYDENNFENIILELVENDEKRNYLINKASLKIKKETYKDHLEWLLEIIIDNKKNTIKKEIYYQKNESSILELLSILNSIGTYITKDELRIFIDTYEHKNLLDINSLNIYALIIANYSLIYEDNNKSIFYKKALKILNKAISISKHPILIFNYAHISLQINMTEIAIDKFSECISLLEEYVFDFETINCIKFPLDFSLFRVEWENSLSEQNNSKSILLWKSYEKIGEILFLQNQYEQSKKYFYKSIESKPEISSYSYLRLAFILQNEQNITEAYILFKEAQKLDPLNLEVQDNYLNFLIENNFIQEYENYYHEITQIRKCCPSYILKREKSLNELIIYDQFGSEIKR